MPETLMILKTRVFSTKMNPVFLNTAKKEKQEDNTKNIVIITKKKKSENRKGFRKTLYLFPVINSSFSLQSLPSVKATLKCKMQTGKFIMINLKIIYGK